MDDFGNALLGLLVFIVVQVILAYAIRRDSRKWGNDAR